MGRRPRINTETTNTQTDTKPYYDDTLPGVWVGCLACYNNGKLIGEWVNGTEAGDFVPCDLPGHEEFHCFDHENYHGFLTGECDPCEAQNIAEALESVDSDHLEPFGIWVKDGHGTIDDYSGFQDEYRGTYDSLKDYAEEYIEECGYLSQMGDFLSQFFDYDAYANYLDHSGFWTANAPGCKVFVFGD